MALTEQQYQYLKSFRLELEWPDGKKSLIAGQALHVALAMDDDFQADLQPEMFPSEPLALAPPRRRELSFKLQLGANSRVVISDNSG